MTRDCPKTSPTNNTLPEVKPSPSSPIKKDQAEASPSPPKPKGKRTQEGRKQKSLSSSSPKGTSQKPTQGVCMEEDKENSPPRPSRAANPEKTSRPIHSGTPSPSSRPPRSLLEVRLLNKHSDTREWARHFPPKLSTYRNLWEWLYALPTHETKNMTSN